MAKSKRGPSLFEKLKRTEGPPRSPARVRSRPIVSPAVPSDGETGGGSTGSPRRGPGLSEVPDSAGERVVSFDGDHLRFSFTSGYAALVIFIAVGCLSGMYWLGERHGSKLGTLEGYQRGRTSYRSQVADEIAAARQQEPASQLVTGLVDHADSTAAGRTDSTPLQLPAAQGNPWVAGLTYIVVQEFSATNGAHVETAQRFLAERDIETVAVQLESGSTQLITKQGYNRRDATQRHLADKFLEKVHETGKSYYATGGGYRLEGYFKLRRDR